MLLSIVTIHLNDPDGLARSFSSLKHTLAAEATEWIVVDGRSTPTKRLNKVIDNITPYATKIISEPDDGIYDAMNKGLRLASSEYVLFINAGDELICPEILNLLKNANSDIVLLDSTEGSSRDSSKLKRAREMHSIWWGMPTHHQAIVIKTKLAQRFGFDSSLKIAADYKLLCQLKQLEATSQVLHTPGCFFDTTGVSSRNFKKGLLEQHSIRKEVLQLPTITNRSIYYMKLLVNLSRNQFPLIYNALRYEIKSVQLRNIKLNIATQDELDLLAIEAITNSHKPVWIGNLNAHAFNLLHTRKDFHDACKVAAHNFCDGKGFLLLLRLAFPTARLSIKQITYNRWLDGFLRRMADRSAKFYFLGDEPHTDTLAAEKCNKETGGACAGFHHGFYSDTEELSIVQEINRSGANTLILGMGMPRQELFIHRNIDKLNVKLILNGGACFKYYSGETNKCPSLIAHAGFEWLYRLMRNPRRLWRRYLIGNPAAMIRLAAGRLTGGISKYEP